MSARDRLLDRNDPEWNATVDEILAEHAHELAEQIRDHPWRECCGMGCSDLAPAAGDLIDPEAKR